MEGRQVAGVVVDGHDVDFTGEKVLRRDAPPEVEARLEDIWLEGEHVRKAVGVGRSREYTARPALHVARRHRRHGLADERHAAVDGCHIERAVAYLRKIIGAVHAQWRLAALSAAADVPPLAQCPGDDIV